MKLRFILFVLLCILLYIVVERVIYGVVHLCLQNLKFPTLRGKNKEKNEQMSTKKGSPYKTTELAIAKNVT